MAKKNLSLYLTGLKFWASPFLYLFFLRCQIWLPHHHESYICFSSEIWQKSFFSPDWHDLIIRKSLPGLSPFLLHIWFLWFGVFPSPDLRFCAGYLPNIIPYCWIHCPFLAVLSDSFLFASFLFYFFSCPFLSVTSRLQIWSSVYSHTSLRFHLTTDIATKYMFLPL